MDVKRQSRPEIILLLTIGVEPKALISKGYSTATVYKYSGLVKEAKKKINEMFGFDYGQKEKWNESAVYGFV